MKKYLSTFILPFCLLVILIVAIYEYVQTGDILFPQLCIIFVLLPSAIKSIKPNFETNPYYKYFKTGMLLLGISMLVIFGIKESKANTLIESLQSAYLNNSKLNAERASMRASKEEKREAVSEFLPDVTISGYKSSQDSFNSNLDDANIDPKERSILVEQKIFQGFGGVANLLKKRKGQKLGELKLKKVEQEILLEAAKVHTELFLNIKKVNINLSNVDLLERQVETDQNRLEKGEISLTDLAQSEASLAGAIAQLIATKNDLITSKANFEKIIGKKLLEESIKSSLESNLKLPESLASAYKISNSENPDLQIAFLEYEQSKLDVTIAASELSPSATLSYERAEQDNISSTIQERTQETVKATASWPIFAGGKNAFNYRKFKEKKNQKGLSYAIIKFTDLGGVFELFVFSDLFEKKRDILKEGNSVFLNLIKNISADGSTSRINVKSITRINDLVNLPVKSIEINSLNLNNLNQVKELISSPGETDVTLKINNNKIVHHFKLNSKRKIDQEVISQLKNAGVALKIY